MSILLLKSLLSLLLLLLALINMYTMFEFFGRKEKRFNPAALKRIHRWNGYFFLILFLVIGYLCIDILVKTRMGLDSRLMFHVVFALAILLLLLTKISYVRIYPLFYPQAKIMGPVIGLLAIGLTAISGGYYLLVNGFGSLTEAAHIGHDHEGPESDTETAPETDKTAMERGRELYRQKCIHCHDPQNREQRMGPGHKNILKQKHFPVSGWLATPENVAHQLREPYQKMPSFPGLSAKEVNDLISYLKTL